MVVTWPSQTLRVATLIDTPGIASLSEQISKRTWALLTPEERAVAVTLLGYPEGSIGRLVTPEPQRQPA